MRHWQPLHHPRWSAFLAGIEAALGGLAPAAPTAPAPVFIAPEPLPATDPAPAPAAPAAPPPEALAPPPAPAAFVEPVAAPSELPDEPTAVQIPPPAPIPAAAPAPAPVFVASPAPAPRQAPVAAAPPPPIPAQDLPPGSLHQTGARAFFSALGWQGGPARFTPPPVAATSAAVPRTIPAAAPAPAAPSPASRDTASTFFQHLPWLGGTHYGEVITSVRVTATRDDAQLDPRTAPLPSDNPLLTGMLSAARTSDRMAAPSTPKPSPGRARAFFSTLPWAHA